MNRKRQSFGLWLMLRLLARHWGELGTNQQQEVINELAAERKRKVDSLRAAAKRKEKYMAKLREEEKFRRDIAEETERTLEYLSEQMEEAV